MNTRTGLAALAAVFALVTLTSTRAQVPQALRPVTLPCKKPYANGEKPVHIAEEVPETFPELAVFNDDGQRETVKSQDLAPLLLNEVQKLTAEKTN